MRKLPLLMCVLLGISGSAVSCGGSDRGDGVNHMYDAPLLGDPGSLDPQFAADESSAAVIKNLYSGLVTLDESGNIRCCNAENYTVTAGGTVYTFTLREDNYWFFDDNNDDVIDEEECFPVTAEDYVFALQRVLDPQMQSPYAHEFSGIKGAEDPETHELSAEGAEIYAADSRTLVVVLDDPDAEFLKRMASPAAYPCNREFFESTKGRYGLDDRSVMSNGAFYVRQWFYDPYGVNNILYMKRNEANRREDYDICPGYLSFTIQESEEDIRKLFKNKDIDCFTTLSSSSYSPKRYSITSGSSVTLGLIFNPKDKMWSSMNVRTALACGVDRDSLQEKITDKGLSAAYGIIPPAVTVAGRSYRELSSDRQFQSYDPEWSFRSLHEARKELNVESFGEVKILVSTDTVDSSYLHLLSQGWQDLLGIYIGIEEVTQEEFDERIAASDYSIALYPLRSTENLGETYIRQFETVDCLETYSGYTLLTGELMKCGSAAELVDRYTAAEKLLLDRREFIPLFYKDVYLIADSDNEQLMLDPFSGAVDYRLGLNFG